MFFCELEQSDYDDGTHINWVITVKGKVYHNKNEYNELYELNFTLGTTNDYSLSLEVEATVANNNTQISCRIQDLPNPPRTDNIEATLTVVGKLAVTVYFLSSFVHVYLFSSSSQHFYLFEITGLYS